MSVREPSRRRLPLLGVHVARKQPRLSVRRAAEFNEHLSVDHYTLGGVLHVLGILSGCNDDRSRLRRYTVLQYLPSAAEHGSRQHEQGQLDAQYLHARQCTAVY